jgi:DNA-binding PadR family transcriptional regulator
MKISTPASDVHRRHITSSLVAGDTESSGALTSYVVPSEEGPHRKYYGLNETGRQLLAEFGKTWGAFAETMDSLLGAAA